MAATLPAGCVPSNVSQALVSIPQSHVVGAEAQLVAAPVEGAISGASDFNE